MAFEDGSLIRMARHRGIKTQIFQGFLLLISRRILFLKQLIAKTCIISIKGPEPEKDAIIFIYQTKGSKENLVFINGKII